MACILVDVKCYNITKRSKKAVDETVDDADQKPHHSKHVDLERFLNDFKF